MNNIRLYIFEFKLICYNALGCGKSINIVSLFYEVLSRRFQDQEILSAGNHVAVICAVNCWFSVYFCEIARKKWNSCVNSKLTNNSCFWHLGCFDNFKLGRNIACNVLILCAMIFNNCFVWEMMFLLL